MGVLSKDIDLSHIPKNKQVLDVGSGSGEIAARIRDERGCTLKAIEPGIEESNSDEKDPYIASCNLLGEDNVIKLTLQEAIKLEEYQHKFDVVTVNKYNVNLVETDAFVSALKTAIKENGVVLIHTVESQRVYKTLYSEPLYFMDILRKHFSDVSIRTRTYGHCDTSKDAVVTCKNPIV